MDTQTIVVEGTSEELMAYLRAHPDVQGRLTVRQEDVQGRLTVQETLPSSPSEAEGPPPGVTPEMVAAMTEGVIWENGVPTIPRPPGVPRMTAEDVKKLIEHMDDEEDERSIFFAKNGYFP